MTDCLFRDISNHNVVEVVDILNKTDERVVLFRSNDGTYRDYKFAGNLSAAKVAADQGRLDAFGVYFVYETNWQATLAVFKDMVGTPHPKMFVVIDVESWGGKIKGDQSAALNEVRKELVRWLRSFRGPIARRVDRILGRQRRRVLGYGNVGDLLSLWPNRGDIKLIVAAYGSNPSFPNKIAHQYMDDYTGDGLPAGDINSADGLSPAQFAAKVGCIRLTPKQRLELFKARRRRGKRHA